MTTDKGKRALATIALAGGTAGAIDFVVATSQAVLKGQSALRPWEGVAAGLFGIKTVIHAGEAIGLAGISLHFLITVVAAAIYHAVAERQNWLVRNPLLSGIGFGALFFVAMNYVILPLSFIGRSLYVGPAGIAIALTMHILMIGLPIALITAWGMRKRAGYASTADA